jgi:hypothetical protein
MLSLFHESEVARHVSNGYRSAEQMEIKNNKEASYYPWGTSSWKDLADERVWENGFRILRIYQF